MERVFSKGLPDPYRWTQSDWIRIVVEPADSSVAEGGEDAAVMEDSRAWLTASG